MRNIQCKSFFQKVIFWRLFSLRHRCTVKTGHYLKRFYMRFCVWVNLVCQATSMKKDDGKQQYGIACFKQTVFCYHLYVVFICNVKLQKYECVSTLCLLFVPENIRTTVVNRLYVNFCGAFGTNLDTKVNWLLMRVQKSHQFVIHRGSKEKQKQLGQTALFRQLVFFNQRVVRNSAIKLVFKYYSRQSFKSIKSYKIL